MPVVPTYPGVYIEELSSGVHTVTPVATSVAAFVGTFAQGPLNVPLQVLSPQDFERAYGGLDRFSETSYAVQQFFTNGGQQAWIVRIADTTTAPAAAAATVALQGNGATPALIFNATAGRQVMGNSAADPGAWGNQLRVQIDYLTADPATLFNLTVNRVQVDGDRTSIVQSETYPNLVAIPGAVNDALTVVNAGSRLIQLDRNTVTAGTTARPDPNGTLGDALVGFLSAGLPANGANLKIVLNGPVIGTITVDRTIDFGTATVTSYSTLRPFLEATIRKAAGDTLVPNGLKPLLSNATVSLLGAGTAASPARFLVRLGANSRPYDPDATITLSDAVASAAAVALTGANVLVDAQQFKLGGGADGPLPAAGQLFRPVLETVLRMRQHRQQDRHVRAGIRRSFQHPVHSGGDDSGSTEHAGAVQRGRDLRRIAPRDVDRRYPRRRDPCRSDAELACGQ